MIGCAVALILLPLRIFAEVVEILVRASLRAGRQPLPRRAQPAGWRAAPGWAGGSTAGISPAVFVVGVVLVVILGAIMIRDGITSRTEATSSPASASQTPSRGSGIDALSANAE